MHKSLIIKYLGKLLVALVLSSIFSVYVSTPIYLSYIKKMKLDIPLATESIDNLAFITSTLLILIITDLVIKLIQFFDFINDSVRNRFTSPKAFTKNEVDDILNQ